MKDQAIQYLAMDVHQSTVVATLRDAQGDIILQPSDPATRPPATAP